MQKSTLQTTAQTRETNLKKSSTKKTSSSDNRGRLYINYKPSDNHPDYDLIGLLKERKEQQGIIPRESMLEATKAFWLPMACLKVDKYSEDCLREIFWQSITKLEAQKEFLWNMVGKALNLERPSIVTESSEFSLNQNSWTSSHIEETNSAVINSGFDYDGQGLL